MASRIVSHQSWPPAKRDHPHVAPQVLELGPQQGDGVGVLPCVADEDVIAVPNEARPGPPGGSAEPCGASHRDPPIRERCERRRDDVDQAGRPRGHDCPIRVVITGINLPGRVFCRPDGSVMENVHVGVQLRRDPAQLVRADATGAGWELDVELVRNATVRSTSADQPSKANGVSASSI